MDMMINMQYKHSLS